MGKTEDVLGSKSSFSLLQTECPDADGTVLAVTKGKPGAAWPVDHGGVGCGGSELVFPGKYRACRAGARRVPSTSQGQMLGTETCPALLHGASGTLLAQNIPRIVRWLRFGDCL